MTYSASQFGDRFTWHDYVVFGCMLAVSAIIGIFYGFFGKKQDTNEFLMAGKSMTTFPVAMSLIARYIHELMQQSNISLGTEPLVYQFGFLYWLIGFSYILVMPSAAYLYFPVFHKLQVTSAYEYLERRFHRSVRWLGSAVFIIQMCLYMAIVVYAPALALQQVTGINGYVSISLICFVCMFYTTLGGMKAVLWTDALQTLIMYASMMFVIIKGAIDAGGFDVVWQINADSGRAQLIDFDPDPTTRHTFWTLVIGGYFTWITIYGVNQAQVQRYLSLQTKQMAINALWINLIGLFILMITCSFGGMVLYANYHECDPIRSGVVDKGDQLFPLFVMDTLGQWRGLPGLFVAGVFSGALSTVSSGMNSLAAIVLEDFIKAGCYPKISENAATWTSRGLSLFFGLVTFGLVFVAEQLGNILSAALSIFGMVGGPLLGVFTLGMFFPWANSTPLAIYRLSYMWYSATGCFTVIVVGMLVTLVTGKQDVRALDPRCLSPAVLWLKNWIPGLDGLGEDYVDEEEGLKESKSSSSLGNVNPTFNSEIVEKTQNGYVIESSKL
ncbi:Sodium-coupled monocarboxylate transporter 2-like 3 [Homarus americanus]|uniref:Sodium-coupled monocarboxylate transporter 2-like 3 n=1 Tax=Homarus americanus TaxID=6706 RepID=A0A8J5JHG7_HOMAM|nr:Sodium-coupled monocarboxylate transporter 2-like 3 [Homarus americanus]